MQYLRQRRLRAEQPVDAASVAVFRMLFGAFVVIAVARFFAHGWIESHYIAPRHHFTFYGFAWVRPWPGNGMMWHFALTALLGAMVALGLFHRVAASLLTLALAYVFLLDVTYYLNHYYLLICLSALLAVLPVDGCLSLDARRKPESRRDQVPAWVLWALRAQVGLVYVFGGIAKLKWDWLLHAEPLRTWLAANTDFPLIGSLLSQAWVAYAFSYAGLLFDLTIVGFLLWPRARPYAFVAVVAFHLMTAWLFQLGLFPWIMIAASLLFLPGCWPRRLASRGGWPRRLASREVSNEALQLPTWQRSLPPVLLAYFAVQVLIPLRHHVYPGDVCWTEQGFRFAWHVMVMEKGGSLDLRVTEPRSGRRWVVSPRDYLTADQIKMVSTQPDLILQLAHWVAEDFRQRGTRDPEVRADAFASLHGRPASRLIDPNVNLAAEHDSLGAQPWITSTPLRMQ